MPKATAADLAGIDLVRSVVYVSRETGDRLLTFVDLLRSWQRAKNLVAASTLEDVWRRHVADSAQLVSLNPAARRWLDLGSGAGFPGMVVAILLAGEAVARVDLVESNQRKCAFLRAAARETGAPVVVHEARAEVVIAAWQGPIDAVSSRAFASLDALCGLVVPLISRGATGWFHKGADFAAERAEAAEHWTMDLVEHPSRIGPGVVAELRSLARRPSPVFGKDSGSRTGG